MTDNSLPLKVPALSDSLQVLLSLDDERRTDAKLLELLITKDPGALARIMARANSAYYHGDARKKIESLPKAITLLGVATTYELLMLHWMQESFEVADSFKPARDWLLRHIFSVWGTSKRLLISAGLESQVSTYELMMVVFLNRLALALYLHPTVPESADLSWRNLQERDVHHLLHEPGMPGYMSMSLELAKQWQVSDTVQKELSMLSHWRQHSAAPTNKLGPLFECVCADVGCRGLSLLAQLIFAGEIFVHAAAHPGTETLEDFAHENLPVVTLLTDKRVWIERAVVLF